MRVWAVIFHVRVWRLHEYFRIFKGLGTVWMLQEAIPLCIFTFPATNNINVVSVLTS